MIQQILIFSRKGIIEKKNLDFNAILKGIFHLLEATTPKNIRLQTSLYSERTLTVRGDKTLIHQVVMNLINNACDATKGANHPSIMIRSNIF